MTVKIFSFVNMNTHVICAAAAIIKNKKLGDSHFVFFDFIIIYLIVSSAIAIPIFWIIIFITARHPFDTFITSFGILLVIVFTTAILFCIEYCGSKISGQILDLKIFYILFFPRYSANIIYCINIFALSKNGCLYWLFL